MKDSGRMFWLCLGLVVGGLGTALWVARPQAQAAVTAGNDRYEDYVLCTGPVNVGGNRLQMDGVWLLDYRAGKLLGTVIDRNQGKITGWAEVDLTTEFGLQPRANVHFLMTAGRVAGNQSALYVAETTSGKFGVYSMNPRTDGKTGVVIKRHDLVLFRQGASN